MNDNDIGITLSADDKALLAVLRDAGSDIQAFAQKGGNSLRELQDAARGNTTAMEQLAGGMKTAFIGGGVAAAIITIKNAIGDVTMAMLDAQMQADKVKNSLSFAMGGPQAAQEIQYLRQVTDQLGVSFAAVAPMYGRLAAATKGTNLEGRATREIFESIAQASVVMGLGVEETEGAMRALVQMVSKGQIQAEELRGQLGERLPRAFQIFADSLGVTTGELSKMLEAGKVAPEMLAQFAATLKGELAGNLDEATTRLAANVNRLDNAWLRLKQNVGEAGVSSFMSGQMAILADAASDVATSMEKARAGGDGFAGQMVSASGAVLRFLNPFNAIGYTVQDQTTQLKLAEQQLKEYEALLAKDPTNTFLIRGIEQIKETVAWLRAANAEKDKFAASGPSHRQMEDASMAKWAEQQAAQAKELMGLRAKLNNVDKDYLPTLEKLNAAWKSGALTQAEYVDLVGKLAKENYKAEKSTAAHADAFGDFVKKLNEKLAAQALELDSGRKLSESDKLRIQFNEELGTKYKKLTATQLAQVDALLKAIKAGEEQAKTTKRLQDAYQREMEFHDELNAAYVAESKAREQGRLAVDAYVQAIAQSNEEISLEQSLFGQTQRNRDIALEQYRIELELKKQIAAINSNPGFNQSQRDELIGKATAAADVAKSAAIAKADLSAMTSILNAVDTTAHDVFVNIFDSGSSAFKKLGQTLKAAVLDLLYQLTLKKWIIQVGASVTGSMYGSAANAAGGSLAGGSNLLSTGASIAALAGGFNTASTLGAFGSSFVGAAGSTLGISGAGSSLAASSAASSAAGFGGASSAGAALGAVAPYLAAAIAIYYIAKQLDHSGTPHTGAGTSYSAAAGLAQASAGASGGGLFSGISYSDSTQQMTTGLVQSIVGILDATAVTFGKEAGYAAAASFADDSSKDGAWGSLVISKLGEVVSGWAVWDGHGQVFSDGAAGSAEYLAKVSADVRAALDGIGLPAWATAMLDQLGAAPSLEQLAAVVAEINKTETALAAIGKVLVGFNAMGDGAVQALIKAAGGIDALASAAATYYDAFYTDAEKAANTIGAVRTALQNVGLEMPTTRAGFRAMVEAQQALGEAGAPALAALLQVSGAFASVVPAAADVTDAVTDAGDAITRTAADIAASIKSLKAEGNNLQVDLLAAQGDTQGAAALRRTLDIAGLTAEEIALYDFNANLRALIQTTNDAAEATRNAAEAAQAEAQQKTGLENTLLQALGETGALRQRELDALAPANRALQEMIYSVTDAQSAITGLNADIARLSQIASQAATLSNSLSVLLGGNDNTEATLWATVNSASATAEEKLSAISQLMGIINNSITADTQEAQRQLTEGANAATNAIKEANAAQQAGAQAQLQAAQKLVEFGQQLRDYVDGLRLGSNSTLTPGEKLALAAQAYQKSLAGAQANDPTAQAALQGNATAYLELARQYDAGGYNGPNGVFATVTGALGAFGGSLLTEGQQSALTAQATLDSIKSVSTSSAATTTAVLTGNVISDQNRQALQTLLDLSTQIEANAVIERAAKEAKLTEETARMEAIRTYLSDTGVIATSVASSATVMTAFAQQQKTDNADLRIQVADLTANLQALQATIVNMAAAQMQTAQDVGSQVASTVADAVTTAVSEAAGVPVIA